MLPEWTLGRARAAFWIWFAFWTFLLVAKDPLRLLLIDESLPDTLKDPSHHADKLVHFVGYLLIGFLGRNAFPGRQALICLMIAGVAHGGGTELIQKLFTTRGAEWWDFAADVAGLALGLYLLPIRLKTSDGSVRSLRRPATSQQPAS